MRSIAVVLATAIALSACGRVEHEPAAAGLVDVIDGDTVRLRISGSDVEVRLVGLNAPERGECHGPEATAALNRLVSGRPLSVRPAGGEDADRFGRLLRYVYAGDDLVNLSMVEAGHGLALGSRHEMSSSFRSAASEAWAARLGMWSAGACGESGTPHVAVARIEADPPGADGARPNDEYVVIRIDGDDAVDLTGWILRDESSSNRFVFEPGPLFAPGGTIRVHSGCGRPTATDLYWCRGPVWSNDADSVVLQSGRGTVVDVKFYTRSANR